MKTSKSLNVFCLLAFIVIGGVSAKSDFAKASSDKNTVIEEQKSKEIEVLLINALPGSGKSEIRKYLSSLDSKECKEKFGINTTVQVDDFPYVHIMRRVSDELRERGKEGAFFLSPALPFREPKEWGTLMHLVNEDYHDLVNNIKPEVESENVSGWLFTRIDRARFKARLKPVFRIMPKGLRAEIAKAIEQDAKKLLKNKIEEIDKAANLKDKTVVIEFSRGGADAAPLPLPNPYGYKYAYSQLSPEILEKASILYVWVSPEESRRKNEARVNPNDPGSILNHCVPRAVMYTEYGCDDIDWLLKNTDKPNTIKIEKYGKTYNLPLGRFDNRVDKTTFTHAKVDAWKDEDVQKLRSGLEQAFAPLMS
jgi:hypothetical protein